MKYEARQFRSSIGNFETVGVEVDTAEHDSKLLIVDLIRNIRQ